jgi:Ca2+-binding RTX toxin-like protein
VRGRAAAAALIAVVALLATAGGANAGQLETSGAGLLYRHLPTFEPFQAHDVVVEDLGGVFLITDAGAEIFLCDAAPLCVPPAGCVKLGVSEVLCPAVPSLEILTGPSNDLIENRTSAALTACGGDGDDVITGGSASDHLGGGAGRDELRGGGARDTLAIDFARMLTFDPDESPLAACLPGPDEESLELLDGGSGNDHIEGGPGDDRIVGGEGHDDIFAYGGDDLVDGGPGREFLAGFEGDDVLTGGADDDFLFGGPGNDDLDGGAGDDDLGRTLRVDADGLGTASEVTILVEDGDDRLAGGDGSDNLTAGPGLRRFDLTEPVVFERLGVIDPRLRSAALNGADRYSGGPGDDLVIYANRDLPVSVTPLDGLANDGSAGEGDRVDADVERLWGGARADVLSAIPQGSSMQGDLGPDRLVGGPGPDRLVGGFDDSGDTLVGAGGDDQMGGGPGDDALDGGPGADILFASSGNDVAAGGEGDDRIEGAAGADRLDGGPGTDCLHGFLLPTSEPACATGLPSATAAGADGADTLRGGRGVDLLYGGDGDDVVDYASARRPVVVALPGSGATSKTDDVLAADIEGVRGGFGPDILLGNAADNVLDGGPGDDHVLGGAGVDQLRGGSGQDLVVARDGEPDAVRCGTKRDLALIDGDDELVASLSDICEGIDDGGGSLGRSLAPVGDCALGIRPRGGTRVFALAMRASLPAGTLVDTSSCDARIGRARVSGGAFTLQPEGRRLVLRLHGGRAGACRSALRVRRLEVRRAPPWLSVQGRDLTATGAGASWTTIDGCAGTRVKVRSGDVRTVR